jgi:hypothetical protein
MIFTPYEVTSISIIGEIKAAIPWLWKLLPRRIMIGASAAFEGSESLPTLFIVPHTSIQLSGITSKLLFAKLISYTKKVH